MNGPLRQCLLLVGLLLPLASLAQDSLRYSLGRFTHIRAGGTTRLTIQQGTAPSITVKRSNPSSLLVQVIDQTLVIESDPNQPPLTPPVELLIIVHELAGLAMEGRSQADCANALVSTHFDLVVNNQAQARMNVVAASMTLTLTDTSQVRLTASLGQLRGQMASSSRLDTHGTYGLVQLTKTP